MAGKDTRNVTRTKDQEAPSWKPPYISWGLLVRLIERLESNPPPRIDRTILKGSNQTQTQTILALKALGLIDGEGAVTESFTTLLAAGESRPARVRSLLERFYKGPVALGRVNGTQQQLEEEFRGYGVSGSTVRKAISFFLKAAEYAGVQTSPHFRVPSAPQRPRKLASPKPSGPSKPESAQEARIRHSGASPDDERQTAVKTAESIESLRVEYVRMLVESVRPEPGSPGQFEPDVLDRIERLLGFGPKVEQEDPQ